MELLENVQQLHPYLIYLDRIKILSDYKAFERLAESIHNEAILAISLQSWELVPTFFFYFEHYLLLFSSSNCLISKFLDNEFIVSV